MAVSDVSFADLREYCVDACQRTVLLLDTLRERGDNFLAHNEQEIPNLLTFGAELILDGRALPRPVNYVLAKIRAPEGVAVDPRKPPIVVVDPRAGHGPGIGGMKPDSEIGVALRAGHACYFIGFRPTPERGQTLDDVCEAEAAFIEAVALRHPEASGKPIVIANCQAGWQTMIAAALHPDLAGPLLLAGSPLAYWAGVRGKNPMRYLGGLLGGTWMSALAGDLGDGIFDGANLVANFEQLNPANTYWTKPYNVYAKVDTEVQRFLDFETWWGSPVLLNAGEMQWIADNLFVGNRLTRGKLITSKGVTVDLRKVKSPIVVFCSWGDDITPPQQALGWILDLYRDIDDLVANDQTIVYALHESIGHLGIFVSGKVASKEHNEFVSCMEMIDLMPPGLYEAVLNPVDENTVRPDLAGNNYVLSLEARDFGDIRRLGGNDEADERRFETAARVSEINLGLYRALVQPWVRSIANKPFGEALRAAHPHRVRFSAITSETPLGTQVMALAEKARQTRQPTSADNPFVAMQESWSNVMTHWLKAAGEMRDAAAEAIFLNVYGSPFLQAAVGLPVVYGRHDADARDVDKTTALAPYGAEPDARFEQGGLAEAVVRALIYIRLAIGSADERAFRLLRAVADAQGAVGAANIVRLKSMAREQMRLVQSDPARAIAALPKLVKPGGDEAAKAAAALGQLLSATGATDEAAEGRIAEVEGLLGVALAGSERKRLKRTA